MNLTDPFFLFIFLPLVFFIHQIAINKYKNTVLFIASIFFYIWGDASFLWLLLFSGIENYFLGLLIGKISYPDKEKSSLASSLLLLFSIAFNVGILIVAKYHVFFGLTAFSALFPHEPLGVSFFTFMAIAYLVDIYRGKIEATWNLIDFLFYFNFFAKIISGPITTFSEIRHDFTGRKQKLASVSTGLSRLFFGLGKKVIIADTLAVIVNQIFAIPGDQLSFAHAWLGIICFTLQIYYDFSGYSDMAIGTALLFGFKLPENFNFPYVSASVGEFWQRWHITLGKWFRNYLYIPLGGNRKGLFRTLLNTSIVFFITGMWHGVGLRFMVWGLWYALFLCIERVFKVRGIPMLPKPVGILYTGIVVMVGWVLFRAPDLPYAAWYLRAMFIPTFAQTAAFSFSTYINATNVFILVLAVLWIFPITRVVDAYIHQFLRIEIASRILYSTRLLLTLGFSFAVLCYSLTYLSKQASTPFIYALF
jgi:alginate O-acetyltransferase complex protein AlgI